MYKRLKKGADIMPIRIDDELPAKQNLEIENIFVMIFLIEYISIGK